MASFGGAYRGKSVFITGHTGFKGSWLCEWLLTLGARVVGYSLEAPTEPALFEQLGLSSRLHRHFIGDVRDYETLHDCLVYTKPDYVFHLAAQPLVRESYRQPIETFSTNVLGTAHLLESLRALEKPCAAVIVTTDKCYQNREWLYGYREEDPLGGHDPYSASKAAAEIVTASFRSSFFADHHVRIASARAGNVIGGGDWALDRIVPDCIRALSRKQTISVRNPVAVRPWQHVLEPLSGYLWLAARLREQSAPAEAFNFGPGHDANRTVGELVRELLKHWPGRWRDTSDPHAVHEARLLQLSTDKANAQLGWSATWEFSEAVRETTRWYREISAGSISPRKLTTQQIREFTGAAKKRGLSWAND